MHQKPFTVYALVAIVGLVIVDVVLSIVVTMLEGDTPDRPAYTIAGSKARGAFVEAVAIEPRSFDWRGQQIAINEVWLEQQTELVCVIEIIPFLCEYRHYRKVAGYNLCLNLAEGWEVMWTSPSSFFVVPGKGSSFSQIGRVVISERLKTLTECPTTVLLTDNWKLVGSRELAVKRGGG